MGNCISRFQLVQSTDEGHSEKCGNASGLPSCSVFPIQEPTQSFWTFPPSSIATHVSSDNFPTHADVVIIGSGISGASFARTLLGFSQERDDNSDPLSVVMLEAQETCSGATGRNGGHINPPIYHDYEDLKRSLGKAAAQQIMRFRLAHLDVLLETAKTEADGADCREVESVDVFFDDTVFAEAKRKLSVFEEDMPEEASANRIWEGEDAQKRYNLSALAVGCVTTRAGAVHPYRFVTDILSRLLEEYPKDFQLFTNTPCVSVTEPSSTNPFYSLTTSRGELSTFHVVHLTNAYVGGLVPGLADVVYRVRETMSAQRPGRALQFQSYGDRDGQKNHGKRSYVFFDSPEQKGFDYLTQIPDGEHELMFGGGREALPETDAKNGQACRPTPRGLYDVHSAAHVSGALPIYFGATNWGAEAVSAVESLASDVQEDAQRQLRDPWAAGRVKAIWSGVLSVSVDEFPWVGRIPSAISGRRSPTTGMAVSEKGKRARMADPGEWIAAGYSGEGMVHAWLCARALALMVLGLDTVGDVEVEGYYGAGQTVDEWLPACYRITVARLRNARKERKGLRSGGETVVRGGVGKMKIYKSV
ncbi:FAD dependent oxidoreductase-domain-containing protein [Boletus reticuloceps]|uniref:FAD dependent oxidoreductase-domain-containing protein n=1 Tax=Boletus reticuloceps TaxID=495285 RepID=A0A8I2YDE6_9AGAM|nr:FAD dependent oxidoreductase-domain-containing protein [Boletus reticuloceps]